MPDPTENAARYRPRWWHRWLVLDVTWMGLPIPPGEGFAEGYLTKRGARSRVQRARRYGIERKVVRRG